MNKVILSEGLEVSAMSIGCWSFGGGAYWGAQSQEDCDRVVRSAIDEEMCIRDSF